MKERYTIALKEIAFKTRGVDESFKDRTNGPYKCGDR